MHLPIHIEDISLHFSQQLCFDDFSATVFPCEKIAIVGRNGSGKSSLLKMFVQQLEPSSGSIHDLKDVSIAYVPQLMTDHEHLSGGQRFNQRLSEALATQPDILLLDEPTNHLDRRNKQSLMKHLKHFYGTLIVVTHDRELIRHCIDRIWDIHNHQVNDFQGSYEHYLAQNRIQHEHAEKQLQQLKQQTQYLYEQRQQTEQRAAKRKAKGQKHIKQRKWPTIVSSAKMGRAQAASVKQLAKIDADKEKLKERIANLHLAELLTPTFHLEADLKNSVVLLTIHGGSVAYQTDNIVHDNIHLNLSARDKLWLQGDNGAGKSTIVKAILQHPQVIRGGEWHLPLPDKIGYLDQHYQNLDDNLTVYEQICSLRSDWDRHMIRQHLNEFLFRKNHEVDKKITHLSGGEKARISLACIAAKPPRLLILDEMTNNVDMETRDHVIQILQQYPGAMILVSHDADFVEAIGVDNVYTVSGNSFCSQ